MFNRKKLLSLILLVGALTFSTFTFVGCGPNMVCPQGGCDQTCTGDCNATCEGGACIQVCPSGASCNFTCTGGKCKQTCAEDSDSCVVTCAPDNCEQECNGHLTCS